MFRFARAVLLSLVALGVVRAAASAVAASRLDAFYLGALWTEVFETPSAENPFATGGPGSGCFHHDELVANVQRHVAEAHPDLIEELSRDDVLAMASKSLTTRSEGGSR
jgi:ABC-type nitrate/sulfonate/bicarbonate transport system substrate-binding protein